MNERRMFKKILVMYSTGEKENNDKRKEQTNKQANKHTKQWNNEYLLYKTRKKLFFSEFCMSLKLNLARLNERHTNQREIGKRCLRRRLNMMQMKYADGNENIQSSMEKFIPNTKPRNASENEKVFYFVSYENEKKTVLILLWAI